jgi:hypothetical protein
MVDASLNQEGESRGLKKETSEQFDRPPQLPSHKEIAVRAYHIYWERGREPGHEIDDWLQAEYELLQLPVRKIAELEPPGGNKGKAHRKLLINLVRTAVLLGAPGLTQLGQWGRR